MAENERLKRELRLLRADHETLLSSTDVRDELNALNDKYEVEMGYMRELVRQKDSEIESLRGELKLRQAIGVESAEENVNETPVMMKGTIT